MIRKLCALFLVLYCLPLASFGESGFPGKYSGAGFSLTLQDTGDGFSGFLEAEGNSFPLRAARSGENAIEGLYEYFGAQIPFQCVLQGETITITSEGESFVLQRVPGSRATTAQPATGGSVPSAANIVEDKVWGVSFRAPDGWNAQKGNEGYVLASQSRTGLIVLLPHQYSSVEQLMEAAREGLVDQGGTSLQLDGAVKAFGTNGVSADFQGTIEGNPARAHVVSLLSPHGTGATIMALTEASGYSDEYSRIVQDLAKTVQFYRPVATPAGSAWKEKLIGARLTYLYSYYSGGSADGSYAGGSQNIVIDLCASGSFRYSGSSSAAADAGSGGASGFSGGSDQGNGKWEIAGGGQRPVLVLRFQDGRVREYELSDQDGKTFLNGERYYRTYADDPNEEHRPHCP